MKKIMNLGLLVSAVSLMVFSGCRTEDNIYGTITVLDKNNDPFIPTDVEDIQLAIRWNDGSTIIHNLLDWVTPLDAKGQISVSDEDLYLQSGTPVTYCEDVCVDYTEECVDWAYDPDYDDYYCVGYADYCSYYSTSCYDEYPQRNLDQINKIRTFVTLTHNGFTFTTGTEWQEEDVQSYIYRENGVKVTQMDLNINEVIKLPFERASSLRSASLPPQGLVMERAILSPVELSAEELNPEQKARLDLRRKSILGK